MTKSSKKSLYKSTANRFFTGVASGVADYIDASYFLVRLLFILLTLLSGIGLVLYITLSVLLPTEDETIEQEDMNFYYNVTHGALRQNNKESAKNYFSADSKLLSKQNIVALTCLAIGILFLQFNLEPWDLIPEMWRFPAIIMTIGVGFLLKSITRKKR